jgi:F0F1-type ATP synthase membrane subunit b/b'
MTNKEKKDFEGLKEGEEKSDKKNHPLSREGWIILLSGEINKEEMKLDTSHLAVLIAFFGALVAFLIGLMSAEKVTFRNDVLVAGFLTSILIILVCMLLIVIIYMFIIQKRVKPLINTREAIISGKLTNFSEIHRKWKEYIEKYYRKLLEKSEMDEEEKESKEGEDSEEKALEKNFKEQKEVMQALQRGMSEIKISLQRIESTLGRTDFSTLCYVFGSAFVGGGLTMIAVIATTVATTVRSPILLLVGVVPLFVGISIMAIGAFYKRRDFRK